MFKDVCNSPIYTGYWGWFGVSRDSYFLTYEDGETKRSVWYTTHCFLPENPDPEFWIKGIMRHDGVFYDKFVGFQYPSYWDAWRAMYKYFPLAPARPAEYAYSRYNGYMYGRYND